MVGLIISPLRGLFKFRFAQGCNLYIPSGLENSKSILIEQNLRENQ